MRAAPNVVPTIVLTPLPRWVDSAMCSGHDPEIFFADDVGEAARRLAEDAALAICTRCLVRLPCLELAMSESLESGIWGGKTPTQRRVLRAQRLYEQAQETRTQ